MTGTRHHDEHLHDEIRAPGEAVAEGLAIADEHCRERGQRLTEMRRLVLAAMIESGKALGAYDLIERVAVSGVRRPAPVAIYRALDFLIEAGLAHRIESRNAFIACPHHHHAEEAVIFFICESCQKVVEESSQAVRASLSILARKRGFEVHANVLEIEGRCSSCRYVPLTA